MDTTPLIASAPALEARFLEPEGFRWGHFTARDGARLRWGHLTAGAAKDCILVGGFLEFIEKYFEVVRDFHARGFNVWCLDWRDQGRSARSGRTRPRARNSEQDAEDLAQFITVVSPRGHRRLLVAHSMGGAISLITLRNHPTLVDAAVLSAPMLDINTGNIPRWVARLMARTATMLGHGDSFVPGSGPWSHVVATNAAGVSNDQHRSRLLGAWFAAQEDLRLDGPTYAWVDAAFALTERVHDAGFLAHIPTPILIGSAGQDLLVDASAHVRAATLLPNARLMTFAAAKHELFHETDAVRERWLGAVDAFVAEHIGPA